MKYIELKNIDEEIILNNMKSYYTRDYIRKAIEILKKHNLKVNIENMTVYENNELIEKFSFERDMLEEKRNFENSENKIEFIIKWYFSRHINNQTYKLLREKNLV